MRVPLASSVGAITGCPGIRRVEVELFDSEVGFCSGLLRSRSWNRMAGEQRLTSTTA
jgi:hypothetical protein